MQISSILHSLSLWYISTQAQLSFQCSTHDDYHCNIFEILVFLCYHYMYFV